MIFEVIRGLPALVLAASVVAPAGGPPAVPTAVERAFVEHAGSTLRGRFHTLADARRSGYFRYSDEDQMGAISYVDLHWSSEPDRPCQLWFDARGRFIGVDYCRAFSRAAPRIWSLDPRRWAEFPAHVHYALRSGHALRYGSASPEALRRVGADPNKPTKATIVRLGLAKTERDVAFVFAFPHVWDLAMWAIPNANGAFADTNPSVVPSPNAGGRM